MTIFGVWYGIKDFNTVLWADLPNGFFWREKKITAIRSLSKRRLPQEGWLSKSNWRPTEARVNEAD